MSNFATTDLGRRAIDLLDGVVDHICASREIPRSEGNRVREMQAEGRSGATVSVDLPITRFVEGYGLDDSAQTLPAPILDALAKYVRDAFRRRFELACASDPKAKGLVDAWDWSDEGDVSDLADSLDEAGFTELSAAVAYDAFHEDFMGRTIRYGMDAVHRPRSREAVLSLSLRADTDFERPRSGNGERSDALGGEKAISADHEILDMRFGRVYDLSDRAFSDLLDAFRQALPHPTEPSRGMTF